jgi:hypothetical protein
MSDDGTGVNLFIPSLMIGQTDAQKIRNTISDLKVEGRDYHVQVKLVFEIRHATNHVDLDMWMSSEVPVAQQFLTDFA